MFKLHPPYYAWSLGDKITIDGIEYSGVKNINQIVPKNFTVYFSSDERETDEGFILNWSCVDFELFWSEWDQLSDGTCNQQRKLISNQIHNFLYGSEMESLIGPTIQYRNPNGSCGKLAF